MVAEPTEHNARAETAATYNRFRLFAIIVGCIVVAIISFIAIELPGSFSTENPIVNPPATATVSNIAAHPDNYYGKYFQVTGKIAKIVSDHGFLVTDNSGQQVLVVGYYPLPVTLYGNATVTVGAQNLNQFNGQNVQVSGTVSKFDLYNVSSTINYALSSNDYNAYSGKPVIVADQVNTGSTSSGTLQVNNLSVAQVLQNPSQYTDLLVTANGVSGQNITDAGGHAFVLGQTASDNNSSGTAILVVGNTDVIPTQDFMTMKPGTKLVVTGSFRQFDLTIAREAIGQTIPDSVFTGWSGKYMLLATQIQVQGQ